MRSKNAVVGIEGRLRKENKKRCGFRLLHYVEYSPNYNKTRLDEFESY